MNQALLRKFYQMSVSASVAETTWERLSHSFSGSKAQEETYSDSRSRSRSRLWMCIGSYSSSISDELTGSSSELAERPMIDTKHLIACIKQDQG